MFTLDLKSRKSLFEQIVDGCKSMIISGELSPGDKLLSVREMSSILTVNPNTIQKAYSRLEQEGWIYMVAGRGAFVMDGIPKGAGEKAAAVFEQIAELLEQLVFLGQTEEMIREGIEKRMRERGFLQ
ncbi:MAG: GntR family transcriptional regulator [Firmicutes bacterium]|nr:GntR family transcriptional regulator [Bacillota bacterium]